MKYCRSFLFFLLSSFLYVTIGAQPLNNLDAKEKIFFNAKIFTANMQQPFAEAILIRADKIIAVGNLNEVKKLAGKDAALIDLGGGFVLPGLIDSHTHAVDGGDGLLRANVFDGSITVAQLAEYTKQVKENKQGMIGDILVIDGINISMWSQLNEIIKTFNNGDFTNQPVWLRGSDGHTSWVNDAGMMKAGINKEYIQSLSAEDKKFYVFDNNYIPNGFMSESGQGKMYALLPADAIDYNKSAEKAMEYNNSYGITAWLDPSTGSTTKKTIDILKAYAHLASDHKLTAHVAATIVADADGDALSQIAWVKELQKKYNQQDLNILGFKIFADGVVEHPTHTAALSKPYTGTISKGVLMYDPQKFNAFVVQADKQHMLVHVHAIGDLAVTKTLDGFEAARKANGNSGLPHTITHMQFVLPSDFQRFKQLNVLASLQLLWAFGDVTTIDIVKPYIDPELYQYQYPARSLLQSGTIICGASDWPVSSGNPFEAMYEAETRKGPKGVLDSSQCMPRIAMLNAYTINAAKALMRERNIGSIAPGKYADLILVDRDVMTADPESFKNTKVLWTLFEGKVVYKAK
ncbi:MAG: amidohydrolase [Bacteroidota bacterium]